MVDYVFSGGLIGAETLRKDLSRIHDDQVRYVRNLGSEMNRIYVETTEIFKPDTLDQLKALGYRIFQKI